MVNVTAQLVSNQGQTAKKIAEEQNGESAPISRNDHADRNGCADRNSDQTVKSLKVAYRVVHAIPGRVRFRVPRLVHDAAYADRLRALVELESQVTSVRINRAAASVVIAYQTGMILDAKMQLKLGCLIDLASIAAMPDSSAVTVPESSTSTPVDVWSGLKLPAIASTLAILGGPFGLPISPAIVGATIAVATLPVMRRALESIRQEQRLNIDFLDFAAIAITTLQGHFLTPSLMLALIELGEGIRERTARSSQRQALDLLDSLGQLVWVQREGEKQQVPISAVQPSDTVIVYPGDQIPVDGRILRGKALIDAQKLTGESLPVLRKKGQEVYASTLVREGRIYIQVERTGADTRAGQSIQLMQEAPVHDTRMENYAAKLANRAVVPTLLLAGGVFATTRNLARTASVLTLDFATGVRVSVPTTVLAALTYAARHGILIRSGRALEQLAQVDTVVFDKTGTLTRGEVAVVGVESVNLLMPPSRLLELVAAAEQRLTHPVAEAIVHYAQEQGISILPRGKWKYRVGLGVRTQIGGQTVLVGSSRFLQQEGVNLEQFYEHHSHFQAGSASLIYVASNGEFQGTIAYQDQVRPESREVLTTLQATEGLEVHLLTGDNRRTASAVARELGIPFAHTHAEAFPEQKAVAVEQLKAAGRTVAFVGDGINDSPALAYADVSISFANGSDIARETADVVLMDNNLYGLVDAIVIARRARHLIYQNTGIVVAPNLAAMALAVTTGLSPLAATVVNNGSTVVAGVNGLRPILRSHEKEILPVTNGGNPLNGG